MKQPIPNDIRPRASDAERWEYILLAGTNLPPEPRVKPSLIDRAADVLASTQALAFLSAVFAAVVLAPQAPGAHNWAAERAAQQVVAPVAAPVAGLTP